MRLLRNTRKTVAVSGALPEGLASSPVVSRRASAPFALSRFTLLVGLLFSSLAYADEGKRIALIIGNDAYSVRPLQNAINDARAMDRALKAAGFKTFLKENATRQVMEESLVQLLTELGPDDTALLFYAGHAVQIENENMLIPVDFQQANSVIDAKYKSFSLARALDEFKRIRHKRTIVILDACRSNPVTDAQSLQAGLAMPLNDGKDTYVAFSTSPNHVATDNPNGHNSYFTEALSDLIATLKDRDLDDIMTRVRNRVEAATEGKQTPWAQSSLTSKFYFYAQTNAVAENDPTLLEKWMLDEKAREQMGDWGDALDLITQVLARKPGGALEANARQRVPFLTARRDAQERLASGDYAAAAQLNQKAFEADPFSIDAAAEAVNDYLLADDLDNAVKTAHAIRTRGSSADVARSELILKELSAVAPAAVQELQAGVPAPPPIEEIFSGLSFGNVDVAAADAFAQKFRPDLGSRLTSALPPAFVTTALTASLENTPGGVTPGPASGLNLDSFHLEIITSSHSKSRNLSIHKIGEAETVNTPGIQRSGTALKVTTSPSGASLAIDNDPDETCLSPCVLTLHAGPQMLRITMEGYASALVPIEPKNSGEEKHFDLTQQFGFVDFSGTAGSTPVMLDGQISVVQVPSKLQLPAGTYEVRRVQSGKIISTDPVEIKSQDIVPFKINP